MYQILSGYLPVVQFRHDSAQLIHDLLILPKVQKFFNAHDVPNYYEVHSYECIGSQDFETVEFHYFYDTLLSKLADSADPFKTAMYAITHDKSLVTEKCGSTGIQFTTVNLGKHPVFYYLLVDLQEIFDFVKLQNLQKPRL